MGELTTAGKHVLRATRPGPRRQAPTRLAGSGAWRKLVPLPALALLRDTRDTPQKVRRHVAALFIDIQGCTRLCEDLPPEEMNELLETYFSEFLDAVWAAGGDVTEVMGDGLLALFEADETRATTMSALRAAVGIRTGARQLNARRRRGHDPVEVNMGLNSGEALVGFTRLRGRSGERWVYAATGPVTNVAARLAALARGGQILTTRETAAVLAHDCSCRSLGPHTLKNVARPVEVIEIMGLATARRPADRSEIHHG